MAISSKCIYPETGNFLLLTASDVCDKRGKGFLTTDRGPQSGRTPAIQLLTPKNELQLCHFRGVQCAQRNPHGAPRLTRAQTIKFENGTHGTLGECTPGHLRRPVLPLDSLRQKKGDGIKIAHVVPCPVLRCDAFAKYCTVPHYRRSILFDTGSDDSSRHPIVLVSPLRRQQISQVAASAVTSHQWHSRTTNARLPTRGH